jgi:hypothetical protein
MEENEELIEEAEEQETELINRSLAPVGPSTSSANQNNTNENSTHAAFNPSASSSNNPFSPIFFLLLNSNLVPQQADEKDIKKSLEYLKQMGNAETLIEDEQAISSLIDINDSVRKKQDKINLIIEHKLQIVLKDLFQFEYEFLRDYVEREAYSIELENVNSKFTTFHLICDLNEILVVTSKEYAALFHMIGGTRCFLAYFGNKKLMDYLTKSFTKSDAFRSERKMNYCKALASMLNSLLYLKTNRTQSFKEFGAIETLTQFCNGLTFENCELILRTHFILSVLASRRQIEQLENVDFTILILEKTIQMFAQACQKKTKYNSYQFDLFYDNDVRSFEISSNSSPNTFIVIVLSVMEAFLVNDEIKFRVFGTIKNSLLLLLIQGDVIEKYFALCLLINFAFDDVLNEKISQIASLPVLIEQLLAQSQNMDESVLALIYCLKSLVAIKQSPAYADTSDQREGDRREIVISFNEVNELVAMRMRNELAKCEYTVRLVEKKTNGKYDIESVTKTIRACSVFIMCVSSSYEYDKLCQLEADLASKLGKHVIPVNVQGKYVPDYWLEAIIDGNNVIPFSLTNVKNDMTLVDQEIYARLNAKQRRATTKSAAARSHEMTARGAVEARKSRTCAIL